MTPGITTQTSMAIANYAAAAPIGGLLVFGHSQTSASNSKRAFDGDITTTSVSNAASSCFVGIDMGVDRVAQVTRVRFYPNFARSAVMQNGIFDASVDGVTSVTLAIANVRPQMGWNYVDVADTTTYRYLRYRGPSNSYCEVRVLFMSV